MSPIKARSRRPAGLDGSLLPSSARASAGSSTGVCPVVTTWRGPRTECAGLIGTTWPVTSQSNRWRIAARRCLTEGAASRWRHAPAGRRRSTARRRPRTRPGIPRRPDSRPGVCVGCECWGRRIRGSGQACRSSGLRPLAIHCDSLLLRQRSKDPYRVPVITRHFPKSVPPNIGCSISPFGNYLVIRKSTCMPRSLFLKIDHNIAISCFAERFFFKQIIYDGFNEWRIRFYSGPPPVFYFFWV